MLDVKDRSFGGYSLRTIQDYIEELQNKITSLENQLAELKEKPSIGINYPTPNYIGIGEVTCEDYNSFTNRMLRNQGVWDESRR